MYVCVIITVGDSVIGSKLHKRDQPHLHGIIQGIEMSSLTEIKKKIDFKAENKQSEGKSPE